MAMDTKIAQEAIRVGGYVCVCVRGGGSGPITELLHWMLRVLLTSDISLSSPFSEWHK